MWGVEAPTGGLLSWSAGALLMHQEDAAPAAPIAGVFVARGPLLGGVQPGLPALLGRVGALELAEVLSPEFPQAVAPPSPSHAPPIHGSHPIHPQSQHSAPRYPPGLESTA